MSCLVAKSYPTLFVTLWTRAHQASLSMGFPRQKYWGRLQFTPQGHLPNPETEPCLPPPASSLLHWQEDSLPLSNQVNHTGIGKSQIQYAYCPDKRGNI